MKNQAGWFQKEKKQIFVALAVFILVCTCTIPALAGSEGSPPFSVYPVLPENQISGRAFFDVEVSPKQTQEFLLAVKNETSDEITVKIEAITATTANNGEIAYSKHGTSDKSLLYPFDSLVNPSIKVVAIPARTEIEVPMRLTTPSKPFDGIILGSFYVTSVEEADNTNPEGVTNAFSYAIAVRLTESQQHIEPEFLVDNAELLAGQESTAFFCDIRNIKPELFKDTAVFVQILKGSDVVLSDERRVDFAPNSFYPLELISETTISPGIYTAQVKVVSNEEVFLLEQELVVGDAVVDIDTFIDQRRNPAQGSQDLANYTVLLWIVIASALFCLVIILIRNKRKKDSV